MSDSLIIKIDGDESGYKKSLKNVKSEAQKAVKAANDAIEKANEAVKKAAAETDEEAKKAAQNIVKEAQKTSKALTAEAQKQVAAYAKANQKAMDDSASVVGGVNLAAKAAVMAVGTVGAAVVGMGMKYNAEMEQYKAGFETMLGSAELADKTISDLKSFAEKTPFELTDLANASTTLLAFGEDVDSLMPDLKMLGDISLGNAEKFKSLSLVFGQVQSQGKLMGQDLLQMINSGFNPLQVISEKTGESMASLKDKMAEGKISFEMVAEAMKIATSEGGQFYNAMETQSKTFTGQLSTLKDNVVSLFGEMSEGVSESFTEKALPKAIEITEELKQMWADGKLQDYLGSAAAAATALGVALAGMNVLLVVNDIKQITSGVAEYTAVTKLGTAAQKMFNAELLKNPYSWVAIGLMSVISAVGVYAATHKSASQEIVDSVKDIKQAHEDAIQAIERTQSAELAEAQVAMTLKDRLYELEDQIKSGTLSQEEAAVTQENFNATADRLNEIIPGIVSSLYNETGAIDVQRVSVDNLTNSYYQLAVAKATAAAYEEKMKETAKSLIDAKEVQKKAMSNLDNAKNSTTVDYGSGIMKWAQQTDKNSNINKAQKAVDKANKTVAEFDEKLASLAKDSEQVKKDLTAMMKNVVGEVDSANKKTTNTVTSGNAARTASTKSAAKEQNKAIEERYKKELRDLKYAHDMGEKSDKEYYTALAEFRNEYFEEGSQEWQQYTLEIYNYAKQNIDKAKDEMLKGLEEITNKQEAFAKGLQKDLTETVTVKGTYTYGGKTHHTTKDSEGVELLKLNDFTDENEKLKRYQKQLEEQTERLRAAFGDDTESFEYYMEQIKTDPLGEGGKVLAAVGITSDEELKKIAESFKENRKLIGETTEKAYDEEFLEFKAELEKFFGELPDDYFVWGEETGEKFGEGFMTQLKAYLAEAQIMVQNAMASMVPAAAINGVSRIGATGGVSTTNTYNSIYNINASSGMSERGLIKAAQDAETLNRMRGGY